MSKMINGHWINTDNVIRPGRIHGYGTTVREYKSLKPKKNMCYGCRDDFYNGKNDLGVQECWCFKDAKVVDKIGHSSIHVCGGPDTIMKKTLSCWHAIRK